MVPIFSQDNTCPDLLCVNLSLYTGLSPVSPDFPDRSTTLKLLSPSLAATEGFDFFPSRVLDFSSPLAWYTYGFSGYLLGFPFRYHGITARLPAPMLSQVTTPFIASSCKASAMCAYSLDHITQVTIGSTYSMILSLSQSNLFRILTQWLQQYR